MIDTLFYVFDLYGIEYSKPVLSTPNYSPDITYLMNNKLRYRKFFDFYGYKLFTSYKRKTLNTLSTDDMEVIVFFNLPPRMQSSYTAVCKFIGNMTKALRKNKDYKKFAGPFYVYDIILKENWGMPCCYPPFDEKYIVDIISWLLPERKRKDIEKELAKDKQLLLKLINCVH